MMRLGPLVLVALIALVIYLVARSSQARRTETAAPPAPERPTAVNRAAPPAPERPTAVNRAAPTRLSTDLDAWVAAGLLSSAQARAILAHEASKRAAAPRAPSALRVMPPPVRARRVPAVAEALGYLGGTLAVVGLSLVVARYWPDMAPAGRLALSGGAAAALLVAGALVHEGADPALARLRWFLWLASTAAGALFAGVVAADIFDAESAKTLALACAGSVALESGLLWQWRARPIQQLTFLGGTIVFGGAAVAQFTESGAVGLAVWALAAFALVAGLRRLTPLPLLTEATGAVGVVVGALMTGAGWQAFGLVFSVASAFGLLAIAAVPGIPTERPDRQITAIAGAAALLQSVPGTLGYFGQDAGMATGLIVWAAGAGLLFVGARRLVRASLVAQLLGAGALLGGAALTGAQWTGFAPLFGIATSLALVGLGMLPGQVLLSVFGSIGLLVNVPWAIAWFFPGEGRAPLLLLISGALILGVAVLLSRMSGRFRRELGGPRRGAGRPPRAAPGAA